MMEDLRVLHSSRVPPGGQWGLAEGFVETGPLARLRSWRLVSHPDVPVALPQALCQDSKRALEMERTVLRGLS